MAKGRKTGGRRKGTPNKASSQAKLFVARVEARLKKKCGFDLEDEAVALLTCGDSQTTARVLTKLLEYKYGKPPQPVEGTKDGEPVRIVFDSIPRPQR